MAYEYDHDCPFEAFITNLGKYNEGELVGEWVKFPTTSEELQKVFERIGIGSKDVDGLYEKLGEYENLDELNYLASKLDELDDHDYNHFQAAMQISDYTGSIKDVINLIDNLDKYEIYPGVESNADLLTLSFDGLSHVTVMSDADAYITDEKGERVKNVTFTPVTGKDNQFTVALTDLAKASYQLVIPEGTFHYEKNNKEVKTQAIKENFTIGKGGSPEDPNLHYDYSIYQQLPNTSVTQKDVALNGFMIKNIGYYDGLVANPDREVRLAVYDNNKTIRTGHFESYVDPEDPSTPTLLLVFDTPIREGELKAELYAIVILKGTFGDTNFGKFLEDKTTTQASDCHTNPRMTISIEVDNDKATGIEQVVNSTEKNNVIYDVQGRKVKQMNRSGIYIVNGKKFVKK